VALLRALGLPQGSEVLLPITLCANPVHAVRLAGLRPVFADISPTTFNMNGDAAERVVGPHTKVLLAVPLFGFPLDTTKLVEFARRHNLIVIEDAAQAVGLRYGDGRPAGALGLCSLYSFGAGKIADAGGGAALLCDDVDLMARVRGELDKMPLGVRNLSGQAERIRGALSTLPVELEARRKMARLYRQTLQGANITHPQTDPLWKYSVLLPTRDERDRVTRALLARGVSATNLYPPLSRFFADARGGDERERFPVAVDVFDRVVNLPLWPQQEGLLEIVAEAFGT